MDMRYWYFQSQWEDGNIFTYVSVSIEQYVKGAGDKEVAIKIPGGRVGDIIQLVSDTPSFRIGERMLLFLKDDFFQVVGWRQGKFAIINRKVAVENVVEDETDFINRIRRILGMPLLEREIRPESEVSQVPVITNISPATTAAGTKEGSPPGTGISDIVITGSSFGSSEGRVTFPSGASSKDSDIIYSWTDTRIECHIPHSVYSGDIIVYDANGTDSAPYSYVITFGTRWEQSDMRELKWPKPAMGENYLVNENSLDVTDELSAIQAAMSTWSNAGADFEFSYGGTTTKNTNDAGDGDNIIAWNDLGEGGPLATNYFSWGWQGTPGDVYVLASDIIFNTRYSWSTTGEPGKSDIQSVAAHELGHTLVLTDLYGAADSEKTMYGFTVTGETKQRSLASDDINGILHLYGPKAGNDPPNITSIPITTATQDVLYTYDVDATDPDVGDTLTYSLTTWPADMTINSSTGVIQWTPTNAQVGDNAVVVQVQDQAPATDTQSFTITVANVNDPPNITSTPDTTATQDVLYTYDVDATDPDVGDTLTYSFTTSPAGMTINSSTGVIQWTPTNAQVGDNAVVVEVQDQAAATDTQSFTITVTGQLESQTLHLHPGRNLISIYLNIADPHPSSVFGHIEDDYIAVWAYGSWERYIPGGPGPQNDLNAIEPGRGYCINITATEEVELTIEGTPITNTTVQLSSGWNFMGYNSRSSQALVDVMSGVPYTSIWTREYNSQTGTWTWLRHIENGPSFLSTLTDFDPGKAYWIHMEQDWPWTPWTVSY
jgi:hypothetical protein